MPCSSVPGTTRTACPASWRGFGCSCASASATAVGDVLDQRAAERHRQQLLAAADAQHRHVPRQRAAHQRQFGRGAALLQRHRRVTSAVAVQRRIDVERAAGDDQRVEPCRDSPPRAPAWCGSATGRPPAAGDGVGIVLPAARTRDISSSRPAARYPRSGRSRAALHGSCTVASPATLGQASADDPDGDRAGRGPRRRRARRGAGGRGRARRRTARCWRAPATGRKRIATPSAHAELLALRAAAAAVGRPAAAGLRPGGDAGAVPDVRRRRSACSASAGWCSAPTTRRAAASSTAPGCSRRRVLPAPPGNRRRRAGERVGELLRGFFAARR